MNEDIIEYLNRTTLMPESKWLVSVMIGAQQKIYTLEDLMDYTQMSKAKLRDCTDHLQKLRIIGQEQGVQDAHFFIVDFRIISMAAG